MSRLDVKFLETINSCNETALNSKELLFKENNVRCKSNETNVELYRKSAEKAIDPILSPMHRARS
jgi:hypothetical protein